MKILRIRMTMRVTIALGVLLCCAFSRSTSQAAFLRAWGQNNYGQTDVPDADVFVRIAAGSNWGVAQTDAGPLSDA